jgi:hypothetical protein
MVLRALNHPKGIEVDPAPGLHGICLECGEEVFSKMYNPDFRHPHFSHYKTVVCRGDKWDKKSEWHYNWQTYLSPPDIEREVRIKCDDYLKRADIRLKTGRVVEVQRSSMPLAELLHREKFYGDMFWIIHPALRRSGLWSGYSGKTFLMDISAEPIRERLAKIDGLCIGLMHCEREENCNDCPHFFQKNDFITQCLKNCIHPQKIFDKRIKVLDKQKMKKAEDRVIASEQWQAQQQKKLKMREKKKQAELRKLAKEHEKQQNELKNNNPDEKRKEWDEKDVYWRSVHERCCGIEK